MLAASIDGRTNRLTCLDKWPELRAAGVDDRRCTVTHNGKIVVIGDHPPTPTATAPAAINAPALLAVIPPVGMRGRSPNGPRIAFNSPGPPADAGKTLTAAAPAFHATATSVGVKAPGIIGIPCSTAHRTTSRSVCGDTRNFAPAATAASASATDMTVPAPMTAPPPRLRSINDAASGLSIVISTEVTPE
jgi:hypothetical protein